jgi:hypothetical protein
MKLRFIHVIKKTQGMRSQIIKKFYLNTSTLLQWAWLSYIMAAVCGKFQNIGSHVTNNNGVLD